MTGTVVRQCRSQRLRVRFPGVPRGVSITSPLDGNQMNKFKRLAMVAALAVTPVIGAGAIATGSASATAINCQYRIGSDNRVRGTCYQGTNPGVDQWFVYVHCYNANRQYPDYTVFSPIGHQYGVLVTSNICFGQIISANISHN